MMHVDVMPVKAAIAHSIPHELSTGGVTAASFVTTMLPIVSIVSNHGMKGKKGRSIKRMGMRFFHICKEKTPVPDT